MPEKHVDTLPPEARHLYENVYATARGGLVEHDEGAANQIAWSAVERFYEEREPGRWIHR